MSSYSACPLGVPSVHQWKAKISFPYAGPPGLFAGSQDGSQFGVVTGRDARSRTSFF
ncbi:hypothetical protein [Alteribacillus sp. YIM 98480]|uniref:hypothetical protein n=1 Tax=Alteribacillus sp. YIM 98480 TaxID=2606599 RepID=UPI00131E0858|nr:hypothetical protein [Alteribacillus sp. YIM 98480]